MKKFTATALLIVLLLSGCSNEPQTVRDFILNTEVYITVYRRADLEAAEQAMALCREYESVFSRTDPGSELSRLNRREIDTVSDPLAEVIQLGLHYSELSGGAFDITMGAITEQWDFTSAEPFIPVPTEIAFKLPSVNWKSVSVKENTIIFDNPQTRIDLGAVAKGYIADRMAEQLKNDGVTSAIISLGGNLYFVGSKPDGSDYQAGIQYPNAERNVTIGGLPICNGSVVTSGIYERSFTLNGQFYHHILDPETGYPAESDLLAVSIVCDSSADCDALSTVCFLLGLDKGMVLLEKLEYAEGIFITNDHQIHLTSGLQDKFYET